MSSLTPVQEPASGFPFALKAPLTETQQLMKRCVDVVFSAAALLVLWPLLVTLAVIVKISSPGRILFRQSRIGLHGRKFMIFKFRTMTVEEDGHSVPQATRGDKRVTRVGAILRTLSLDELPQLINVLRGEMSLVGPRPHAVAHDYEHSRRIVNYALRHRVRPGITGWAQVHGLRGETPTVDSMDRRVRFDLWYIQNWSIWLDFWIMARTVVVVLAARNAY